MEESVKVYAPAAFLSEGTLERIEYEAWWAPEPIWRLRRKVSWPVGIRRTLENCRYDSGIIMVHTQHGDLASPMYVFVLKIGRKLKRP